jgi:phosphoribosylcarboxyaminoimidazole (NCAIR) mutase
MEASRLPILMRVISATKTPEKSSEFAKMKTARSLWGAGARDRAALGAGSVQ